MYVSKLYTFPALLVLGICIHFTVQRAESQHIPTRCVCLKSRNAVQGPFSDFLINWKRLGCRRDEIIVILKKDNRKVCLTPHGPQGKRLLKCLHRKQKEGKSGKKCLGRLRPRLQKKPRVNVKSKPIKR